MSLLLLALSAVVVHAVPFLATGQQPLGVEKSAPRTQIQRVEEARGSGLHGRFLHITGESWPKGKRIMTRMRNETPRLTEIYRFSSRSFL